MSKNAKQTMAAADEERMTQLWRPGTGRGARRDTQGTTSSLGRKRWEPLGRARRGMGYRGRRPPAMMSCMSTRGRFDVAGFGLTFSELASVASLRQDSTVIPAAPGVYLIEHPDPAIPEFLETGSGGRFKGRDPNVDVEHLRDRWILGEPIVYIGKAGSPGRRATLRSRLQQYLRFGEGRNVGHWGGRHIWQLPHSDALQIRWAEVPLGAPRDAESALLRAFEAHHGQLPFANLRR